MIEKVNPKHPDKIADRIAGYITDVAYDIDKRGRVATEVLIGHNTCTIIIESNLDLDIDLIRDYVSDKYLTGGAVTIKHVEQDIHLSNNQEDRIRVGDNGIFKGVPLRDEDIEISRIARELYDQYDSDGKYILDGNTLTICQSNAVSEEIDTFGYDAIVNPLGDWSGGINVDTGATNRKLGSDMGTAVTGGGLHGKDLSKADVTVNVYAHIMAQITQEVVEISCSIGDEYVDGIAYEDMVVIADNYIQSLGGFEKFAEWGLF